MTRNSNGDGAGERGDGGAEPDESWLITPIEASHLLSVSRSKLYQLLAAGSDSIPSVTIGRCRRIRRDELRTWLQNQR